MTLQKTVLNEPAIRSSDWKPQRCDRASWRCVVKRHSVLSLRAWVLTALLFPSAAGNLLAGDFPVIFGLQRRLLQFAQKHTKNPGKISSILRIARTADLRLAAVQATYGQTSTVQNLQWMRLFASLLLGAISLVTFRGLRTLELVVQLGPMFRHLACLGTVRAGNPASWAVGWPLRSGCAVGDRRILHR